MSEAPPKKTICNVCGEARRSFYDQDWRWVRDLNCADRRVYLGFFLRRVLCRGCQAVKRERLDWLADNPRYTMRFAFAVGRRCRSATVTDVAEEMDLDWQTVKDLDKQYMAEQLRRAGEPAPQVIGIDEISVGPGHAYRIVVSDLERVPSGSADKTAPKRVWTSSFAGLAPRNVGKSGWP